MSLLSRLPALSHADTQPCDGCGRVLVDWAQLDEMAVRQGSGHTTEAEIVANLGWTERRIQDALVRARCTNTLCHGERTSVMSLCHVFSIIAGLSGCRCVHLRMSCWRRGCYGSTISLVAMGGDGTGAYASPRIWPRRWILRSSP